MRASRYCRPPPKPKPPTHRCPFCGERTHWTTYYVELCEEKFRAQHADWFTDAPSSGLDNSVNQPEQGEKSMSRKNEPPRKSAQQRTAFRKTHQLGETDAEHVARIQVYFQQQAALAGLNQVTITKPGSRYLVEGSNGGAIFIAVRRRQLTRAVQPFLDTLEVLQSHGMLRRSS